MTVPSSWIGQLMGHISWSQAHREPAKANSLQAAVLSAAEIQSPQALRVLLIDFSGRSLRALESLKHVLARVTDATALDTQLSLLEVTLVDPPADAPRTIIVIDEYRRNQ